MMKSWANMFAVWFVCVCIAFITSMWLAHEAGLMEMFGAQPVTVAIGCMLGAFLVLAYRSGERYHD